MLSRKRTQNGEREKEMEGGNKASEHSPVLLHGGVRPASGREEMQTPPSEAPCPSEFRLVLLGRKGTGKSTVGNTILDIREGGFTCGSPTEVCTDRWADVAGRRVVIVDTPGWDWYYPLNGTPDWVKWETVRSVTLSPPGPHALLLVVRACASIDGMYLRAIQEHMELLGEAVWKHTLVLFTQDDAPDDSSIEGRIRKGGADFQLLVERCENRWHVLNSRAKGRDTAQVVELLQKVEKMVAANGGALLEVEQVHRRLEQEDEVLRPRDARRSQRLLEVRKQGESLREIFAGDGSHGSWREEVEARWPPGCGHQLFDLRVVLLGERENGKSLAGNAILGGDLFRAGVVTEECVGTQREVAGRQVTVVDTPGWECERTPSRVQHEIRRSVTLCPPGPHALLLVVGVDSDITVEAATEQLGRLGEEAWRYTMVLFTGGDKLRPGVTIEQHVQSLGKASQLVERCEGRYHVINSMEPNNVAQVAGLLKKVEDLVAGNGGQPFTPLTQEIREMVRKKEERSKDRTQMKKKSRSWREKVEEKLVMGREEEEERRQTEMRKLLYNSLRMETQEEKEKNYRILAILDQEYKLREWDIKVEHRLKIEQREMEIKALKQKNDEKEIELLTVERQFNQDRQKWEEEWEKMRQNTAKEREELVKKTEAKRLEIMERTATTEEEMSDLRGLIQSFTETEEDLRKTILSQTAEIVKLVKLNQEKTKEFEDVEMKFKKSLEEVGNLKENNTMKDFMLDKMKGSYEEQKMKGEAEIQEKIEKHNLEIRELLLREKDKEMKVLKQHYEEEVSKVQMVMRLKDEEKERQADRSRHKLTEQEFQLELKDRRISELMDQAQENKQRREMTEKQLNAKFRKREDELEEKMKKVEEEMRERYEHSERQRANLQVMIEHLKNESAEMEKTTVKEWDEIKQQHEKKELQMVEEFKDMKIKCNELQKKVYEKEREMDKLKHITEEMGKKIKACGQKYEEQIQREDEWKEKYEKMLTRVEEMKLMEDQKRKVRETEIHSVLEEKEKCINELKQKYEESEINLACLREKYEALSLERDVQIEEMEKRCQDYRKEEKEERMRAEKREMEVEQRIDVQRRCIEELKEINEKKDKEMRVIKQHYEDGLSKVQMEMKQKDEEKEREAERSRQNWTEREAQILKEIEEVKLMKDQEIKVRETEIHSVLEEKEKSINELKQKYEESEINLVCLREKYEALSLERDAQIEELKKRCQDYRKEEKEERMRAEKREMEVEQRIDMQRRCIEELKEINEKKDKEMRVIKQHYEDGLSKVQMEMNLKDEEKEREAERSRQNWTEREAQILKEIEEIKLMKDQEIKVRETEIRLVLEEKEKCINELKQKYEESEINLVCLREKYEALRLERDVQIEEMEKRCQDYRKEEKEERMRAEKREMEVEQKLDMQRRCIEELNEINEKKDKEMRVIKQHYEEELSKVQMEMKQKDEEKAREAERSRQNWTEREALILKEIEEVKLMEDQKRKVKETEVSSVLEEKEKCINELKQKYENLWNESEEQKKRDEMRETELRNLKTNYEEQMGNTHSEYERKLSEREAVISEMEGALKEKDKDMEQVMVELKELQKRRGKEEREVDEVEGIVEERGEETEGRILSEDMRKEKCETLEREMEIYMEKPKIKETDMEAKEILFNELTQKYEGSEKRLVSMTEGYEETKEQVEKPEGLISQRATEPRETNEQSEEYKDLEELQWAISQRERGVDWNNLDYPGELMNKEITPILKPKENEFAEKELHCKGGIKIVGEELMVTISAREAVIRELKKACENKVKEIKEFAKTHKTEINNKESNFYHKLKVSKDQLEEPQLRYIEK